MLDTSDGIRFGMANRYDGARGMQVAQVGTAHHFPRISIVMPSFNQATYLEEAICSVLDQKYPDLEFMILDGGSTDGSLEIIERHASRLDPA
jgi:cellulose synthase/poly-beta-1,6-N-acetylglucosamine synthase-like glycosyltransferase